LNTATGRDLAALIKSRSGHLLLMPSRFEEACSPYGTCKAKLKLGECQVSSSLYKVARGLRMMHSSLLLSATFASHQFAVPISINPASTYHNGRREKRHYNSRGVRQRPPLSARSPRECRRPRIWKVDSHQEEFLGVRLVYVRRLDGAPGLLREPGIWHRPRHTRVQERLR
jgi:hypothetical protein